MASEASLQTAQTALRRFGLGARPGEVVKTAADPRGFLLASLANTGALLLNDPDLDASNIALANVQLAQRQSKMAREGQQDALREAMKVPYPGTGGVPPETPLKIAKLARPNMLRGGIYQDEAAVRFDRMVTTDHAFLERLVLFWSNHFCVSATKGPVRAIAGAFEREAIRPHVLGRFVDMLLAVEQHPAMLIYLDNQLSIGPNSQAGQNRKRGLNENLAREILELHTLGVGGGYTQDDVTNLARIIAGWSVGQVGQGDRAGSFSYLPQRREAGVWPVVGKRYNNIGVEAGRDVLRDLSRHPATALHVARKLATHFVADPPPPELVTALARTFRDTDGDLAALAKTLVTTDIAWTVPRQKMLPPNDFLTAAVRGLPFTLRPKSAEIVRLSNQLGQPLWMVPSPKGWPDSNDAWSGPSALRERLRIAEVLVGQMDRSVDPRLLADDILGGSLTPQTKQAVARAETREQGFELLIMSPEFQRR
jgi:uncharacterized protein (DUF1800 family)